MDNIALKVEEEEEKEKEKTRKVGGLNRVEGVSGGGGRLGL